MTTANTNTSHTDLRLDDGETFILRLSHIISEEPNLKFFLLHWPHTVHGKKCTKNSLYCWLGSGIKSTALCCGLVSLSSGLRWWMRRSRNEMWVTVDAHCHVNILLHLKFMMYVLYLYLLQCSPESVILSLSMSADPSLFTPSVLS